MMLRRVLEGAGVHVPGTPEEIVASLNEAKTNLQTLVLHFEERDAENVPVADRARIDAMHVGALGLASVDNVLSASLQARQLVEAIRARDRARTVRAAILYYGSHLACCGGPVSAHERDVHALLQRLVERGGSAEELAFSRGTYGVGLYMRGRWREAMETIDAAYANLPSQQAGMQAQAAVYALYCLASLGQLAAIGRRTGVANILGINFAGFIAWWLWRTVYLSKLPRLEKKVRVATDWTLDLCFTKDFACVTPPTRSRSHVYAAAQPMSATAAMHAVAP